MEAVVRHYVLQGEPGRPLAAGPAVDEPWTEGARLTRPPAEPLVFTLDRGEGDPGAVYAGGLVPVWSEALVAAMREAGADNLEAFPAVLRDPGSGKEWTGYRAVNVVGCVAGVDFERSGLDRSSIEGLALYPSWFVLAEPELAWFRLFRLAESPDLVVVDERVREAVERRGVAGVTFVEPGSEA